MVWRPPSWLRRTVLVLGMPVAVGVFMMVGAIIFQALLYTIYDQPIFDNTRLPGADDVAWLMAYPAMIRWPAQLLARAWHMWSVVATKTMVVLVTGTLAGWAWQLWSWCRASRRNLAAAAADPTGGTSDGMV